MFVPARLFLLSLPLLLVACQLESPPMVEDACGASSMQDLVGQPASILAAMTFPIGTRIISPDMAVTEDYSTERLNIYVDEAELISRVSCG